jgi:hypothetical protein
MAITRPSLKKSVTIDPDVLDALIPERRENLSATVNDGLQLLAALDAQGALVEAWEAEHGPFSDDELRPFLEAASRAQVDNLMRLIREGRRTSPPRGQRGNSSRLR